MTSIAKVDEVRGAEWSVRLERLESPRGAQTFRVSFAWAPKDELGIVLRQAVDYYEADTLALARAIYERAELELGRGREPFLRDIARELKQRDPALITTARAIERGDAGVVLLGDTPADEIPRRP